MFGGIPDAIAAVFNFGSKIASIFQSRSDQNLGATAQAGKDAIAVTKAAQDRAQVDVAVSGQSDAVLDSELRQPDSPKPS
jgi:hypothetical protein